ncbi:MAG: hypothetical protein AAGH68_13625 [Pseudomonadota bacterium]
MAAGDDGRITHRVQYLLDQDRLVAEALPAGRGRTPREPYTTASPNNVVSLTNVRTARDSWSAAGPASHLCDMIAEDGGAGRHLCLPHMGSGRAWRILPAVLPSFIGYLCERQISFVRIVPTQGLVQGHVGPLAKVNRQNNIVFASAERSMFSLDMNAVDTAWVTVCGSEWQLELYGADRKALAALGCDPMGEAARWRDLLASLPSLGSVGGNRRIETK